VKVRQGSKTVFGRWLFACAGCQVRLQPNPIDSGGANKVKAAGAPREAGQVWRFRCLSGNSTNQ
jgi:hypothetical protein